MVDPVAKRYHLFVHSLSSLPRILCLASLSISIPLGHYIRLVITLQVWYIDLQSSHLDIAFSKSHSANKAYFDTSPLIFYITGATPSLFLGPDPL
jgi:hypothetical protein